MGQLKQSWWAILGSWWAVCLFFVFSCLSINMLLYFNTTWGFHVYIKTFLNKALQALLVNFFKPIIPMAHSIVQQSWWEVCEIVNQEVAGSSLSPVNSCRLWHVHILHSICPSGTPQPSDLFQGLLSMTVFLAHLSRRFTGETYRIGRHPASIWRHRSCRPPKAHGELIVWYSSRRPSVLSHFHRSSALKTCGQSKPNFTWSIYRKGGQTFL